MDFSSYEDYDTDAILRTSTPTESGASTPISTIMTDLHLDHLNLQNLTTHDSIPGPGSTYLIKSYTTHQVVTLKEGCLVLQSGAGDDGGWKWACVEKKGWLGFRNIVSGTYIGHDDDRNFRAEMNHHREWEYFCVRRHPSGAYLILMLHDDTFWKMCEAPNGCQLVERRCYGNETEHEDKDDGCGEGLREFVKV